MSCEESYLAIRRYLTDEREPYAPGTHGNTKRKIRKAAACYVVRNGILYYQRRQKGLHEFTELEVVLQAGRRKELIDEAHIIAGGEHLNQHQTWENISQKYWWRGKKKRAGNCYATTIVRHSANISDRHDLTHLPFASPKPSLSQLTLAVSQALTGPRSQTAVYSSNLTKPQYTYNQPRCGPSVSGIASN